MVGAGGVLCGERCRDGGGHEDSPKGLHLPWPHNLQVFTAASPPTASTEMPLSLWLGYKTAHVSNILIASWPSC